MITVEERSRWGRFFDWEDRRLSRDQYLTASIVRELRALRILKTTPPGKSFLIPSLEDCLTTFGDPTRPAQRSQTPEQVRGFMALPLKERIELHKQALKVAMGRAVRPPADKLKKQPPEQPQTPTPKPPSRTPPRPLTRRPPKLPE